jgi:two-component system, cell cycle sensor histidine kinase and response regulator CckA
VKLRTPLAPIFESQNIRRTKTRWMVVDDNADVLESISMLLDGLGRAEVYKLRSGEEALNCFALYPDEFELVITDFGLPGLNGAELCSRMREISPSVKIILSTGSTITSTEFAKNVGFNGILQKPYTAEELWRVVQSVLPDEKE